MSWFSKKKQKKSPNDNVVVPTIDLSPPRPAWSPGPTATELQAERQALLSLLPDDGDDLDARREYANWLATNGWDDDAERLRAEIEKEELYAKAAAVANRASTLASKGWDVQIGNEQVQVAVTNWSKGQPTAIKLSWEQLDRFGVELLRMAPIVNVELSDEPEAVIETDNGKVGQVTATIMTAAGTTLTGTGYNKQQAVQDALTRKYGAKVSSYPTYYGLGSGSVSSGQISAFHIASGAIQAGYGNYNYTCSGFATIVTGS